MKKVLLTLLTAVTLLTSLNATRVQAMYTERVIKLPEWWLKPKPLKLGERHKEYIDSIIERCKDDYIVYTKKVEFNTPILKTHETTESKVYVDDKDSLFVEHTSRVGYKNIIKYDKGAPYAYNLYGGLFFTFSDISEILEYYEFDGKRVPVNEYESYKGKTRKDYNRILINSVAGVSDIESSIHQVKLKVNNKFNKITAKYLYSLGKNYKRNIKIKNGKITGAVTKYTDGVTKVKVIETLKYGKEELYKALEKTSKIHADYFNRSGSDIRFNFERPEVRDERLKAERLEEENRILKIALKKLYFRESGDFFGDWNDRREREYQDFFTNYGEYKDFKKVIDGSKDVWDKDKEFLKNYFKEHRDEIITGEWYEKSDRERDALREKYSHYPGIFSYIEFIVDGKKVVKEGSSTPQSSETSESNLPDDYNEETDEDWENDGQ